jgi:hypothetical protein
MPPTSKVALLARLQRLLLTVPLPRLTVAVATLPRRLHLLRLLPAAHRVPVIDESLLCLKRKHHHAH